jgi:hypothetical protein
MQDIARVCSFGQRQPVPEKGVETQAYTVKASGSLQEFDNFCTLVVL